MKFTNLDIHSSCRFLGRMGLVIEREFKKKKEIVLNKDLTVVTSPKTTISFPKRKH